MEQMSGTRLERLLVRLDTWQRRRKRIAFVYAVLRKYTDDEAGHRAGLLAYYGFLALFPLLMVMTTIFRILLHNNSQFMSDVIHTAVSYFPAIGSGLQENVHALDSTGPTLVVGVLLALFGARGVADVMRSSLDHIWQVPYAKRSHPPASIGRSFLMILIGGLGLAVTPVIFGYAFSFAHSRLESLITTLFTAVVLFWVIVLIIKVGTSTPQPVKRIWTGALLAVISLSVLQSVGGYIVGHQLERLNSLYGTFALVLGFTFWLYLQAQLVLLSFEVSTVQAFKLHPRSMQLPLTAADHKAYRLYRERARFHDNSIG